MSSQEIITNIQEKLDVLETEISTIKITKTNLILAKETRNKLLQETDKYLLSDFPISEDNLILVKEYRTSLRNYFGLDEVKNYSYPDKILPDLPKLNLK